MTRTPHLRITLLLLAGVTVASTAFIVATTASALLGETLSGRRSLSGLPMAAGILGTGLGTHLLSSAMLRHGRRRSLIGAYCLAGAGAAIAIVAAASRSFPLLVLGLLLAGMGQSASPMTRYILADLALPHHRGRALSLSVWVGTVGAVLGPNLLAPSSRISAAVGFPQLGGAYVVAAAAFWLAALLYLLLLFPDPSQLTRVQEADGGAPAAPAARIPDRIPDRSGLWSHLGERRVQVALTSLVLGHAVMVLIMTMTPVHLRGEGHPLAGVGMVLSAHIFGMFALAPLVGWLADRWGRIPTVLCGQALLLSAAAWAALAPSSSHSSAMASLFLLGLGWSFGFVAASSLLTTGLPPGAMQRIQGQADSVVWISAAIASASSSVVLGLVGYPGLCWIGFAMVLVAVAVVVGRGRGLG